MRIWILLVLLLTLAGHCEAAVVSNATKISLKVMTFNVWMSGTQVVGGLQKIVDNIRRQNVDIVLFQELYMGYAGLISAFLGPEWSGFEGRNVPRPDMGFITRHLIDKETCMETPSGVGCQITIRKYPAVKLRVWSVHLSWQFYGPYTACLNKTTPQLVNVRSFDLQVYAKMPQFMRQLKERNDIPMLFGGDFNEPSHLDWINSTRKLHCGQTARFNSSLQMNRWGFVDAFRKVKPDVLKVPGNTWSTVEKMGDGRFYPRNLTEPQDRIDFIYYSGRKLTPINAFVLPLMGTNKPRPDHYLNDWPSDHSGVVAEFHLLVKAVSA